MEERNEPHYCGSFFVLVNTEKTCTPFGVQVFPIMKLRDEEKALINH